MYLDTCIEPWPGGYTDPTVPAGAPHQLCAARGGAGAARRQRARTHRRAHPRRQPGPGLALGQAGAAQHRRRYRGRGRQPGLARRLGRAGAPPRREGRCTSPSATRRSSNKPKQLGEFVNTWSVDGFVSEGCAAGEMGWGTHERNFPRDGKRHDFGCLRGDLPDAAGRGHARAHLDAARRDISTASASRTRRRSRSPTTSRCARARRSSIGRPCTTRITRAMRRSSRCTSSPGATTCSRNASASSWTRSSAASMSWACCSPDTRRTPTGTARSCRSRRRASSRPTTMPRACRCASAVPGRRGVGDGEPESAASSSRMRWISAATSRSACRTGPGRRRVHRLDAAARARAAVPRGHRQDRSLAVQERAGDLVALAAAPRGLTRPRTRSTR